MSKIDLARKSDYQYPPIKSEQEKDLQAILNNHVNDGRALCILAKLVMDMMEEIREIKEQVEFLTPTEFTE